MNVKATDEFSPQPTEENTAPHSLVRAALDVLPDAIFLLDSGCTTASALNAAAIRLAQARIHATTAAVAQLFPDFSLSPRVNNPLNTIASSAHYDLYPVTLGTEQNFVLIVRSAIAANTNDDLSLRDALDDAFHDPLTRLANRRLFERRLQRAIDRAVRSKYHFAVLFVDLDRFKQVNDRFGHLQGDRVLVAAAHRLVEAVRPQDMVARRDGDEFTILLDDLECPEDAVQIAQRIVEHLQLPLGDGTYDSPQISIGASIGIAMANDSRLSADELIARADSAMYQAKALGGSTYVNLDHAVPRPR
jgi:diguanylate cyclase (GGDEF)-like protein